MTSPFKEPTFIMSIDSGENKSKRFYFDSLACETLNITDDTEISFLSIEGDLFIIDTTNLDKKRWKLRPRYKINKRPYSLLFGHERYPFRGFTNSQLWDIMEDACDVSKEYYNFFNLIPINADTIENESLKEMLLRMGVKLIFKLDFCRSELSMDAVVYKLRAHRLNFKEKYKEYEDLFEYLSPPGVAYYSVDGVEDDVKPQQCSSDFI